MNDNNIKLAREIRGHISNPNRREGEDNLALLVAQELGACRAEDRAAKAGEIAGMIASAGQ